MLRLVSIVLLFSAQLALAVELKVNSGCSYPVWLATLPNSGQGNLPDGTVVRLDPGQTYTYQVM